MSLMLMSPTLADIGLRSQHAFSYGMPMEAPGPLSEVTKPTVRSAAEPRTSRTTPMRQHLRTNVTT